MAEWANLSKYVQSKYFKTYMHENNIQNGEYFKKMKSLISEGKSKHVVKYDQETKKVVGVDFKHELFVKERSKKKKLAQVIEQSKKEQEVEHVEVINEEVFDILDEPKQCDQSVQHVC